MYLTNALFFRPGYEHRKPTDFAMTKYILEKGGDINFELFWDEDFRPGRGDRKGTAMDYVLDIPRKYSSRLDVSGMVRLVHTKVILVCLTQIYKNSLIFLGNTIVSISNFLSL